MPVKSHFFTIFFIFYSTGILFGQAIIGRVVNEKGIPLEFASISVSQTSLGAQSDSDGYFEINLGKGSYKLGVSFLGYQSQSIPIEVSEEGQDLGTIQLLPNDRIMNEVVVSGSRTLEKITESPASIDLIEGEQFENFVGSPEELFALQKGVDFTRAGNFIGSISIRGFNSSFNQKMLLLDDNRIANIRIRTPVGPMSPFVKEDIERVEIVLGPSSALYGPNCLNGLFYTLSKSPFDYAGTTAVVGAGSNELLNFRFRHAQKINVKWAYKATFEYLSGTEERNFTDSVYLPSATPGVPKAYAEVGLDRDVEFLKGVVAVFYRPDEVSEFGLNYSFNDNNSVSIGSRNNLVGWYNAALQATYKSSHWFAQFYQTWIKQSQSINTVTRTGNYYSLLGQGQSESEALENSLNGPRTATFIDDSHRLNGEVQYHQTWDDWDFVAGAQYQREVGSSENTLYLDEPVILNLYGLYSQLTYAVKGSGLKLLFTARGDEHSLYGFNFLPKAGVTFSKGESTWRLTYGEGYSAPTMINSFLTLAGGTILGNSEGFTLSDGTSVAPIQPEVLQTLELGFKSIFIEEKLFLDTDVYYNWQKNMISPIINIVPTGAQGGPVVVLRGDRPITDFAPSGQSISTNINYGKVNTFGFDLGLNYYLSKKINLTLNYSFFDYTADSSNPVNDVNGDGRVDVNDIAINTPKHKISSALNAKTGRFYGSVFARWVQKYDFFSGRNVAAKTNPEHSFNGSPVVENQRVGGAWNYGQLGGFYLSINGNYQFTKNLNLGLFVNNILGAGNYEFVASPPTETTFGVELKVDF